MSFQLIPALVNVPKSFQLILHGKNSKIIPVNTGTANQIDSFQLHQHDLKFQIISS